MPQKIFVGQLQHILQTNLGLQAQTTQFFTVHAFSGGAVRLRNIKTHFTLITGSVLNDGGELFEGDVTNPGDVGFTHRKLTV